MRRSPLFALPLLALCAQPIAARADGEAACGGEPFRLHLQDVKGRTYQGVAAVSDKAVVLAYYQGYKSADVLENVREALKADPVVGKGTARGELWAGFAIIDYKEGWFVPGWAIDKALREKMAKFPKAVFLKDQGECMTKGGPSDKCPGGQRTPYFKSNQGSVAVLYRGHLVRKFAGPTEPAPFVALIRRLTEQAQRGASFCEAKAAAAF